MANLFRRLFRLFSAGLLALALAAWAIPSDVVRLISKEEFILLGRYGIDHFNAALVLTLLALVTARLVFAGPGVRRERALSAVAWSVVALFSLFAVDLVLRVVFDDAAYVHVGELRLRPPNMDHELVYRDAPLAHRSLPRLEPGYPDTRVRMRTDSRGFRNPEALERTDVLLIGDSFTEGSRVGDDATWAALVARRSGRTVYNIANSGDDPQKYLAKYRLYGQPLRPRVVVLTLYEGNDFRRAAPLRDSVGDYSLGEAIDNYFKFAPIRVRYERLLRDTLGPLRADAPVRDGGVLAWLPFAARFAGAGSWYFVQPKRVRLLYTRGEDFAASSGWHTARDAIDALAAAVSADGARLLVMYAPTKARTLLPLVVADLDPDAVLGYMDLGSGRRPDGLGDDAAAARLAGLMAEREGDMERIVADHMASAGITFVSLTGRLRESVRGGAQPYFTYDQHWSPDGHRVVAEALAPHLRD